MIIPPTMYFLQSLQFSPRKSHWNYTKFATANQFTHCMVFLYFKTKIKHEKPIFHIALPCGLRFLSKFKYN